MRTEAREFICLESLTECKYLDVADSKACALPAALFYHTLAQGNSHGLFYVTIPSVHLISNSKPVTRRNTEQPEPYRKPTIRSWSHSLNTSLHTATYSTELALCKTEKPMTAHPLTDQWSKRTLPAHSKAGILCPQFLTPIKEGYG